MPSTHEKMPALCIPVSPISTNVHTHVRGEQNTEELRKYTQRQDSKERPEDTNPPQQLNLKTQKHALLFVMMGSVLDKAT